MLMFPQIFLHLFPILNHEILMEVYMKFIFPQNFNFKNKLFGVIDYPTVIFNIIYFFILISICNLIVKNITLKISIITFFYLPIFLLSVIDFNHENILYYFWYMIKFYIRPKIYLYK